jgi:hypothetical protein
MRLLPTFQILFCISSLGVSQELIFISNQMREGGREGGDLRGSVVVLLDFNEKIVFQLVSADHVQIWSGVGFPFVCSLQFTTLIFLLVSRFFCWILFPHRFFLPFVFSAARSFSPAPKFCHHSEFLSRSQGSRFEFFL